MNDVPRNRWAEAVRTGRAGPAARWLWRRERGRTGPPAGQPTTSAPAVSGSSAVGKRVTAQLTDFAVTLSQTSFSPGAYTFVAEQKGQRPHALAIRGSGADGQTPVIQPGGGSHELAATLAAGTYELCCPVGTHRAQGMTVTITVS